MNTQSILKLGVAAILVHGVAAAEKQVEAALGKVPLAFEANRGQTDPSVKFLAHGNDYSVFLTATEAVFTLTRAEEQPGQSRWFEADREENQAQAPVASSTVVVRMKLAGANPNPKTTAVDPLPARITYLAGPKSVNTTAYRQILYENVWPGVYLVYYGNQRALEYDFVVAPGTAPSSIRLGFEGAERARIDSNGDLVLDTPLGELRQHAPSVYQTSGEERIAVEGRYAMLDKSHVGFQVGAYDTTRPLIIDPVFTGQWGGSKDDVATAVAVDKRTGEIFVTGYTDSPDFPVYPRQTNRGRDAFLTKLDPTGHKILFSTYFGGSGDDQASGIALDKTGNVYLTGRTNSPDFPRAGYVATSSPLPWQNDYNFFVAKFDASGKLWYSEQFGGSGNDYGNAIAVDYRGWMYVVGQTYSNDFRVVDYTRTHLQGVSDAFLAVIKWESGSHGTVRYSRYLGSNYEESAKSVALDPSYNGSGFPNVYIAGWTSSSNFSSFTSTGGYQKYYRGNTDGFAIKLHLGLVEHVLSHEPFFNVVLGPEVDSSIEWATFIGGSDADVANGIAVDPTGLAYVTGFTSSKDFTTTPGAFQRYYGGGRADGFVLKISSKGVVLYATYFGGTGDDYGQAVAINDYDSVFIAGYSNSRDLPVTQDAAQWWNAGGTDGFLAAFTPGGDQIVYASYFGNERDDRGYALALGPIADASQINATVVGYFTDTYYGDKDAAILRVVR